MSKPHNRNRQVSTAVKLALMAGSLPLIASQSALAQEAEGEAAEFEEITVVLGGMLRVEHEGGSIDVRAGQAVVTAPGEWVRYSTPEPDGAEYVAVCLPAFSPDTVHRDAAE